MTRRLVLGIWVRGLLLAGFIVACGSGPQFLRAETKKMTAANSYLVYVGIRETKKATNAMVFLKIAIVIVVIAIGFFYVTPANWHPFMPNGFSGVMKGVSGVFFAAIFAKIVA